MKQVVQAVAVNQATQENRDMYESFFGFERRPFSAAPTAEFYFPAKAAEQARLTLTRCIERGTGPGLLVAPTGVGKTLLCHVLAKQFEDRFAVALLAGARISSPRALLQAILFELGLPFRDMHEGELRLSLIDHVAPSRGGVSGMLLLVDEAHMMSPRLLEEIRMITNLVRDGELRVRVILCGNGKLEERFASPKLESFNQRIAARCYLESFDHNETGRYVEAQVAAAGGDAEKIFVDGSLTAIHRASDGIPRIINQVADHALMLAAAGGQPTIDAAGIDEAWSDLQQLPTSLEDHATDVQGEPQASVIEFGSLSDDEGPPSTSASWDSADDAIKSSDPTERLDEIERHVAAAQDDWPAVAADESLPRDDQFDPADAIPPEVELTFHDADDPFDDSFAEEEVVGARILPFETAPRSAVRSEPVEEQHSTAQPANPLPQESEQIADAEIPDAAVPNESPDVTVREAKLSVVARQEGPSESDDEPSDDDETAEIAASYVDQFGVVEFIGGGSVDGPGRASPERSGAAAVAEVAVAAADDGAGDSSAESSVATLPLVRERITATDTVPADDRDIILVEDGEAVEPAAKATSARQARPRYRRLFAQLRQRQA